MGEQNEGKDEKEERKIWNECKICLSEYSEDIRINPACLHSFCYECIQQTAATSNLCPICQVPLSSSISTLPYNYTLQSWRIISPLSKDYLSENQHKEEEIIPQNSQKYCEECEKQESNLFCNDCNHFYCSSCSNIIHAIKVMKNHQIINAKERIMTSSFPRSSLTSSNPLNNSSNIYGNFSMSASKLLLNFHSEKCNLHDNEEKKLYCGDCNEIICVYCIDDQHIGHRTMSVLKFIDQVKEQWKNSIPNSIDESFLFSLFGNLDHQEDKLKNNLIDINKEIERLKKEIDGLEISRHFVNQQLDQIIQLKFNFDLINRFLYSFLQTLPPLPLSSFFSPSSNLNNNFNINNFNINNLNNNIKNNNLNNLNNSKDNLNNSNDKNFNFNLNNSNEKNKTISMENLIDWININGTNIDHNNNNNEDNKNNINKSNEKLILNDEINRNDNNNNNNNNEKKIIIIIMK